VHLQDDADRPRPRQLPPERPLHRQPRAARDVVVRERPQVIPGRIERPAPARRPGIGSLRLRGGHLRGGGRPGGRRETPRLAEILQEAVPDEASFPVRLQLDLDGGKPQPANLIDREARRRNGDASGESESRQAKSDTPRHHGSTTPAGLADRP
jgi:hypothetical protein